MSKTEIRIVGIYEETYNRLKEKADKNGHKIIYLANKFIKKGLNDSELEEILKSKLSDDNNGK